MATDVTMPQLGESVTEGTITRWLKKPGDRIAKYEPLCEVATDKVNAEVPATISGTLLEIVAEEGATVEVGQLICRIEEEGSTPSPQPADQGKDSAPSSVPASSGQEDQSMKRRYSPAVLRLAQEHGIDLEKIEGTGKGGRITRKDVLRYIEGGGKGAPSPSTPADRGEKQPAAPAKKPSAPEIRIPAAETPAKEGISIPLEAGDQEIP
ncbi:MAG: biotin/lipoyl-containing protein, partial [Planifilum fimeticola]